MKRTSGRAWSAGRKLLAAVSIWAAGEPALAQIGGARAVQERRRGDGRFRTNRIAVEVLTRPLGTWGRVSYGLGLRASVDDGESLWLGGGIYLDYPLNDLWTVEATVMPGYYNPGSPDFDLGSDLEIHSSLGIGRTIGPATRLSLAFTHLSNAGTSDRNPGRNALALRLRHGF